MSEQSHSRIHWLWRAAPGLIVGAALLGLLTRRVDLEGVWKGLSGVGLSWAIAAFGSVLLTMAAKIMRWGILFPPGQRPSYWKLAKALLAGQAANALFPVRAGDLLRAYLIGDGGQATVGVVLGTVATEKALDVFFLLVCAGLVASMALLPAWVEIPLAGLAAGGLLFLLLVVFWPSRRFVHWVDSWAPRLPWKLGEWLPSFVGNVLHGVGAMRAPRTVLVAGLWSLLIWVLAAATNYLLLMALDLSLPLGASVLLLVVLHVGVAPPSTPGKLGVFHSVAAFALESMGADRTVSLVYATILHFTVYLPQLVPGVFLLGSSLPAVVHAGALKRRRT